MLIALTLCAMHLSGSATTSLGSNKITDSGAAVIAESMISGWNTKRLQILYVPTNDSRFVQGPRSLKLKCAGPFVGTLRLFYNTVTDVGARTMVEAMNRCPNTNFTVV